MARKLQLIGELKGEAGYTPVKGVDYFTEEDKNEVETDIIGVLTPTLDNKADTSALTAVSDRVTTLEDWRDNLTTDATLSVEGSAADAKAVGDALDILETAIDAVLPAVTTDDDGKILQVVDGVWAAATLPVYAGETEDVT